MPEDRTVKGVLFRWNEEGGYYEAEGDKKVQVVPPDKTHPVMWRVRVPTRAQQDRVPQAHLPGTNGGEMAFEFAAFYAIKG